ncbi:hypothetical protein BDV29DRAFT_158497 [Aspergillus leporis]|uniref:Amidohydrolase-related domain-containing protein n=1 Tax=Aspergillus leporis TaxID=41062 RepID=A0A5N5WZ21_9EURO|nr:hypothetical protein BDV29DRAFT_158497 [Aspergillus leporis]
MSRLYLLSLVYRLISILILGVAAGSLRPPDSWDSHIHVIEPEGQGYTPKAATRWQGSSFHKSLGIKHGVIVLPSVYNHENTVLLDAIRYFNGTYRGVCVLDLDSKIENSTLDEYHAVGVGGIRLNYGNEGSDEEISATATKAAMIALPRDTWEIHWYPTHHMENFVAYGVF